jgi:hypothetical protein
MDIFKMSFFENPGIDLKFSYIITSSASALPIFAGLPLCFYLFLLYLSKREHYAANRRVAYFFTKDGSVFMERLFIKLDCPFFGDVLNTRRDQNSIYVPK